MTKPYRYQKIGVRKIQEFKGRALLADEMGLGKTYQSLEWARRRRSLRPIVVICPASLKWNWEHEALVHINMRAQVLEGLRPPRGGGLSASGDLIILNYEILGAWLKYLRKLKPKIVIIDESHFIKNPRAKRTKNVRSLCHGVGKDRYKVPHVICLSGTPLTNRPAELWSTLNLIRPDLYQGFYTFGHRYCKPQHTPWGIQYKGAANLDELHSNLKSQMMIRRRKRDVLTELPDKSRHVTLLGIERREEYRHALADFMSWMRQHHRTKAHRAKQAEKLVKTGYLKRLIAELKLKSVLEWIEQYLEETSEKLIVFGIHRHVINGIYEPNKRIAVKIDGGVSMKEREYVVNKFQNDNRKKLFVGQLKAAGVGLNLTAASAVGFAELGWTPGEHTQGEDRIHRIGQKNAAQCFYLIARDTIEENLCRIIQEKQIILDSVLDDTNGSSDLDIFTQLEKEIMKS